MKKCWKISAQQMCTTAVVFALCSMSDASGGEVASWNSSSPLSSLPQVTCRDIHSIPRSGAGFGEGGMRPRRAEYLLLVALQVASSLWRTGPSQAEIKFPFFSLLLQTSLQLRSYTVLKWNPGATLVDVQGAYVLCQAQIMPRNSVSTAYGGSIPGMPV